MKYFMSNDDAWNQFCNAKTSKEQDEFVSAVSLSAKPKLQSYYKSLENEDLSVEHVFHVNQRIVPQEFEDIAKQSEQHDDVDNSILNYKK